MTNPGFVPKNIGQSLGVYGNVINAAHLNNLILHNNYNQFQYVTINTVATTSYTWTTPATAAPSSSTSLLTVNNVGTIAYYSTPTSTTQMLVSTTGDVPIVARTRYFWRN